MCLPVGECYSKMKFSVLNEKGYSALELLITLVLACFLLLSLCTYFIYHYQCFIKAEDQLEVQYHMQIAMETLVDKLVFTKGIHSVQFYDASRTHVRKIVFDNSAQGDHVKKKLVIEHRQAVKSLWYGYGNDANVIFANDITYFFVEPIEGIYQNCRGIKIILRGSRGSEVFEGENVVFFRNYDRE